MKRYTGSMICYDSAARIDGPDAFTNHNIARGNLSSRSPPRMSRGVVIKNTKKKERDAINETTMLTRIMQLFVRTGWGC